MPTLGALLDDRDAQRFIGRRSELAQLEELFGIDSPLRVVHLHGPAGIGKSTLLRELSRRGQAAGWTPRTIEGRDIQPTRTALAEALAGVEDERRPLILFDTYELISGLDGPLRAEVLRALSDDARVVFASRRPPHPGWAQDGWEAVTLDLPVGPLRDADALALLQARGVPEAALAELARDGAGNPLALELLAGSATSGGGDAEDLEATVRTLVGRLAGSELEPLHREVLYISAIARVTTAALIADVLPDHDPVSSLEWLATRSFAEPLGAGFALHDLVRRAVHADLRHRDPERERVLRRRIADHLHARAVAGDMMLSIDLSHLVENPLLRWGYSWMGADRFSADGLRPGDVAVIARRMAESGRAGWWTLSEPLCELMPSRVVVVRDLQDAPAGFAITLTPGNAPPAAWEHAHLGPWLRHARDELRTENAVLWEAASVLNPEGDPLVQSMLGMIGVLRSGLRNPRYAYLPINPALPGVLDFVGALGTAASARPRHRGRRPTVRVPPPGVRAAGDHRPPARRDLPGDRR